MTHILIICTANICRSPLAEAMLRDRLHKQGHTDWTVSSAGTWARLQRGASRNSVIVGARQGLDLSNHAAKIVEESHLVQSDLVLCMENGHAEALRVEFPDHAHKVFMFSEMLGKKYNISDPYGGVLTEYERMGQDLETVFDGGFERIVTLATNP